jgi:phosphopantothenate-cysteine ligase
MNILITSGGTAEKIDAVRKITNSATGALGRLLADSFGGYDAVERVFYIHGENAARPKTPKAEPIPVSGVAELDAAVREILSVAEVHAIVHSMAVSDYRVRAVTTAERVAQAVWAGPRGTEAEIEASVRNAAPLDSGKKISSEEASLVLFLERAPKIIARLRTLAPDAPLVGFKLLDGVPRETLLSAARGVMEKNDCFLVLANDAREITANGHVGYLLDRAGAVTRYGTKEEIARGVAERVMTELGGVRA